MSEWAIEVENLVKKFPRRAGAKETQNQPGNGVGEAKPTPAPKKRPWPFRKRQPMTMFTAVDGVSFRIEQGEIFGLLGPNGAGKTTTIRMLCTLLEPTSGTARLNGYDILKQPNQVRQSLGTVLAGERSIYWKLTARENLEYFAALYHIPPDIAKKRIADLLKRVELDMRANDLVEKHSSGMKQRVAISKALLSNPPILLLVGRTITNMITTAITSLAMILIAALVFGFRPTGNALAAFLTALPMLVGLYGFAFAALVLIMREANTLVDVSSYLVQIFAGTNFPIDALPRWLLSISPALPLTYGYDAVRGWLLHTRTILPIGIEIAMLIVFMFVLIALGTAVFNALERRVRVHGTLGQH